MNGVTVRKLMDFCKKAIDEGYGDKLVLVTDDDEANGYHAIWYGFTVDPGEIAYLSYYSPLHDGNAPKDVVLLG